MATNHPKYTSIETHYTCEERMAFLQRYISLSDSGNEDKVILEACF